MEPNIENFKFELGEKIDHHYKIKFHGESIGNSLDALKRCLDRKMAHKGLIGAKNLKYELGEKLDHHFN